MRAIVFDRYGPPDVLTLCDVEDPQPLPHEIRIAVRAATVNRVLDVALRRGEQAHRRPVLPLIPGVDCAGVVDAVGSEVTRWRPGDRVAATGSMPTGPVGEHDLGHDGPRSMLGIHRPGGFAERVCVPAVSAHAVPDGLGFHEAAVVMRHCPTAWNLIVNVAGLRAGEWILVMGAGGNLGTAGVQIARHVVGARVIGVCSEAGNAAMVRALGADHVVVASREDLAQAVMRLTGGRGVDVLYDNVANPRLLPIAFRTLAMHGRMVTAGAHAGPTVALDMFHLYDRRITIRGTPDFRPEDVEKCFVAAASGRLEVRIARVLPLGEAPRAHALMEADPRAGKIVLDPTLEEPSPGP